MQYSISDYTFWGLLNNGIRINHPITTLAYIVALVDNSNNDIIRLDKTKFVLRYLFDMEEQVADAAELISLQKMLPEGYHPQTPVMLTLGWSPISAILETDNNPIVLSRHLKPKAFASGVWGFDQFQNLKPCEKCGTPQEIFWYILNKAIRKAKERKLQVSIIAAPGWSYENGVHSLNNMTLHEAQKADRIIWQRTPRT